MEPENFKAAAASHQAGAPYPMETRVCTAILVVLTVGRLSLSAVAPEPVLTDTALGPLSELEHRFSHDPNDVHTVERLAATYTELRRPALAIALIRSVGPHMLDDPMLSHQLARAYESVGRIPDALGTANLALARCARAAGSSDANNITRAPERTCTERSLASLERHRNALGHMNNWGVQDAHDPRTALAYRISERRVSLASFSAP